MRIKATTTARGNAAQMISALRMWRSTRITAMLATTKAVQVFGGYGYMLESPVQRYFRDARTLQALAQAPLGARAAVAVELLPP